jgi:hypothetical protein
VVRSFTAPCWMVAGYLADHPEFDDINDTT